uniref:Large ribosomal subunit protein bL9m n=1 Tax=Bos indicus x Bos taurus TaxID=30522 RepID=A0A4W2DDB4_BOBOX
MAAAAFAVPRGVQLRVLTERLLRGGVRELLRPRLSGSTPGSERDFSLSHSRGTVIVERWWKVPLAGEGRKPRLHRRHRVYKLVEDTKHRPKENLELILTQSVDELGVRGDLVSVKKSVGRNRLLPEGLAVYASPENKKLFEEEKLLRQEGKLDKIQTKAGEELRAQPGWKGWREEKRPGLPAFCQSPPQIYLRPYLQGHTFMGMV